MIADVSKVSTSLDRHDASYAPKVRNEHSASTLGAWSLDYLSVSKALGIRPYTVVASTAYNAKIPRRSRPESSFRSPPLLYTVSVSPSYRDNSRSVEMPSGSRGATLDDVIASIHVPTHRLTPLLLLRSVTPAKYSGRDTSTRHPYTSTRNRPAVSIRALSNGRTNRIKHRRHSPSNSIVKANGTTGEHRNGSSFAGVLNNNYTKYNSNHRAYNGNVGNGTRTTRLLNRETNRTSRTTFNDSVQVMKRSKQVSRVTKSISSAPKNLNSRRQRRV